MIIVRFQGGLGNQLFQYALYKELGYLGKEVKADLIAYRKEKAKRSYRLEEVFGIQVDEASAKQIFRIAGGEMNLLQQVVRKFIMGHQVYKEKNGIQAETVRTLSVGYLNGYWQSIKWFPNVVQTLQQELVFKCNDNNFLEKCRQVSNEESVSIHVRLGDYLENSEMYGGICTKEYYYNAISYIQKNVANPKFYVFSDEPENAEKMLKEILDAEYVDNCGIEERDLQLMCNCKHNILANSSFSWWGAFLNKHKDKIVIAPSRWNNIEDCRDIYMDEWVRV